MSNLKRTRFSKIWLTALFCACFAVPCPAADGTSADLGRPVAGKEEPLQYYEDAKRGWFWYEEPQVEPDREEDKKRPVRVSPSMKDYTLEELWDMHPDDFQALLNDFHKNAVRFPTEQNVIDYLTMQDIARRKAAIYANVAGYVTQKYPAFNVGKDSPIATPGRVAKVRLQRDEIRETITEAAKDHALIYFKSSTCSYCAEQKQILNFFVGRYGWQIKEIDIRSSPGVAAHFNIHTVPALLLIGRGNDEYIPVSSGVVSLERLERNLFRGVRLLDGKITPEQYSIYDHEWGGSFDYRAILHENTR